MYVQMVDWAEKLRLEGENELRPRYLRVQDLLREAVASLPPGTALPGEVESAALAGVSRETIRKAMSGLVAEGVIVARRGQGTYTATPRVQTGLNRVQGFTDAVRSRGRIPSTKVVRVNRELADLQSSEALRIRRHAEVWVLERIRFVDDHPAMVETAYLPAARLPGLDSQDLTGSLYSILAETYRLAPEFGEESIFAVNADRALARQLDIPIASALLASVRISQTRSNIPIERTVRFVRPELCTYSVTLAGSDGLQVRSQAESHAQVHQIPNRKENSWLP